MEGGMIGCVAIPDEARFFIKEDFQKRLLYLCRSLFEKYLISFLLKQHGKLFHQ